MDNNELEIISNLLKGKWEVHVIIKITEIIDLIVYSCTMLHKYNILILFDLYTLKMNRYHSREIRLKWKNILITDFNSKLITK